MRKMLLAGLVVCGTVVGGAARAQDAGEVAFAAGQFVGAATFCGVPRAEVTPMAKAMLDMAGVDSSGPSPGMTRFTEGVAAGTTEMKEKPPASCDEVKAGFAQMKDQMKIQ